MLLRWIELFFGIFLMSLGVGLTIHSTLGTTPNSALAAALAPITGLTVGVISVIANVVYVIIQIVVLRERYRWIQLLQVFTGAAFGVLVDVSLFLTSPLQTDNYLLQWVLALAGIVLMGVGIGVQVHANLINLPGEGMVLAITSELRRIFGPRKALNFGNVKIVSDVTHVVIAIILGLVFLGRLEGVREATIVSAFALGIISRATLRWLPERPEPLK